MSSVLSVPALPSAAIKLVLWFKLLRQPAFPVLDKRGSGRVFLTRLLAVDSFLNWLCPMRLSCPLQLQSSGALTPLCGRIFPQSSVHSPGRVTPGAPETFVMAGAGCWEWWPPSLSALPISSCPSNLKKIISIPFVWFINSVVSPAPLHCFQNHTTCCGIETGRSQEWVRWPAKVNQ